MLSITKINASTNQKAAKPGGKSYPHYLGAPTTRQRGDFDDYARGKDGASGPAPFWACKGSALLGLDDIAEAEQVERLAKGFHPITGKPLVKGAGDGHVMGLDMTFSAPKDFSAVFAGADRATQDALVECLAAGTLEVTLLSGKSANGRLVLSAEKGSAGADISFDPEFANMILGSDLQFAVNAKRRQSLKSPLAKWLHDFISTHLEELPLTLAYLRELAGFEGQQARFPDRLISAMDELKAAAPKLVADFAIQRSGKNRDRWMLSVSFGDEKPAFTDPNRPSPAHKESGKRGGVAL